jgi:hypothetical protein
VRRRAVRWALPLAAALALGVWLLAQHGPAPAEPPLVVKMPSVETPPVEKPPLPVETPAPPVEAPAPPVEQARGDEKTPVKEKRKRPHRPHGAQRTPHPLDDSDLASPF